MWLFALFDLPVKTQQQRRRYAQFRKELLANGFVRLQLSVYARYCPSDESAAAYRRTVRNEIPADGAVRLVSITDRQFARMESYIGAKRVQKEDRPLQLMLF